MSRPLRVLVTTDSFPPVCGGSGWSTWELVRGLSARGHDVRVIKIAVGAPARVTTEVYESFPVTTFQVNAPRVPVLRNLLKNERLWRDLTAFLLRTSLAGDPVDVIHAQHVMTTVPSIRAGLKAGIPVVATVRDYWPVCYWSDLIYDPAQPTLCPACSVPMMRQCVRPRAGSDAAAIAAWSLIPYMRANLRTKRRTLADASAVISVSSTIARDLEARAPEIANTPHYTIPNPVDMVSLDAAYASASRPIEGPYVFYAGKLAVNKGAQFLLPALGRAGITWPVVVAGDGPLRAALETDARARGVDLRVLGWLDRSAVWAWMRHATLLAFPSYGPESLSRVLLEAAALGVPIAAMNTGGTADIIQRGVTGLLADGEAAWAQDLATLAADERMRAALGHAARADVHARFAATAVVKRIEAVCTFT